ncbi:oligosaccharide flippase family protein [Ligilactobacillus sp. WILCCON 0076]|uniref:Oligosaccharide flippase family protein n=1 Tax=Ligilactobacillus ubinensis TaxID=2876789 RepID=A0A9X2JLE3_9LACO|nr:oligosaccharide flippase family protein [Ligilactobacillus ubinensis]MCP0886829.1 oligosaccharide flippase family protein [Ligilactobacillus ubinensis]
MKKNFRMKTAMKGALILSVASLIAKILSAFYRIPFENIVGNTGFYVYQQIYPIYGIGMTFALSGFPMFISKLIAEQQTKEQKITLSRYLFFILSCFAVLIFVMLRMFGPAIANSMGDASLVELINSVAWMFLFMPILAVGRGYYQGVFNMVPTAISQVSEQLVRVIVIIVAAWLFTQRHWTYYHMGAWAMSGATFGAFCASLSFVRFYMRDFIHTKTVHVDIDVLTLAKRLITEGFIICLFASLMVLLQLVDSFTVKQALQDIGLNSSQAKDIKGTYDRAQPLVQLGMVVAVSFSSTLLPSLTETLQTHRLNEFRKTARAFMHVSVGLGCAATVGLIVLMPEINTVLFGNAALSGTISIYMLSIILITLVSTYTSILQSLNQFKITIIGLVCAIVVKVGVNTQLIYHYGIAGASIATVLSLLVAQIVISSSLPSLIKGLVSNNNFMVKLGITISIMAISTKLTVKILQHYLFSGRFDELVITLCGITVGGFVFIICAVLTKTFTIREWLTIPGGKKLLRFWGNLIGQKRR